VIHSRTLNGGKAAKMADASLIGVIVGGGLAICGGLVSGGITVINQWLDRADRKKKLRAEKLEELVRSIYDFDHWMGKNKDYYLFGATENLEPSPFARVEAISAVYFPMLREKISACDYAASQYLHWMTKAGQKRLQGKMDELHEGFNEAYRPYGASRHDLLVALGKYGEREFS
jgi:hypothetical protein